MTRTDFPAKRKALLDLRSVTMGAKTRRREVRALGKWNVSWVSAAARRDAALAVDDDAAKFDQAVGNERRGGREIASGIATGVGDQLRPLIASP